MAIQSSPRFGFGPRFGLEIAGIFGALAVGVGIGAVVFNGSSDASPRESAIQAPAGNPPRVTSAAGVGALSEAELVAAEKAIHDLYMDAMFGQHVDRTTSAQGPDDLSVAEFVAAQKAIHDAAMDAMFGPYVDPASVRFEPSIEFDIEAARYQHDELLP